ncbi:MAG TPA: tetratricopeptide repeat protein [Burkholderiales bacterium]|nr:tetratricopeptide repeat protein [Burkholderiales bacterium]
MLADRYELPLSTSSPAARDAYVAGADCILSATAGYREHLGRAIEADPAFALPHIALARGLFLDADVKPAREAAARARGLAHAATPREQSHTNAIALALEGKPVDALAATRAHLANWPRDAMVLAPATGVFGLIGFSGRQAREPELYELLTGLAPHYGDDWWFRCVHAFAASETSRLDEALRLIEPSMAANPRNAHGAHSKVHVLHEMGEMAQVLDYLEDWMPGLDKRSLLHCHLSWHVALTALALGKLDRAWQAYRSGVHPGGSWGPPINVVSDCAAFLWRTELAGERRRPELWREVQEYALKSFPKAGVPFADVHTAVACVANGDHAALERLVGEMRDRIAAGKFPPGAVVPTIGEGFAAYAKNDWNAAIRLFEQALPETVRIGGSRAQRDLVEHTLLAAYLKAGRAGDARKLIERRTERRATVGVAGFLA